MSTLSQRRWQQFRDNKRAYRSAVLFLILFTISLFAEFVANDKPILMYHNGEFWTPVLADYTERELGGEMETAAVYWDPYVQDLVAESGGWMVWPPIPYSYKTADMYLAGPAPMAPKAWPRSAKNGRRCFAAFSARAPAAVSVGRAGADYRPAPRPIIAGRSTPATHPNQRPRRTGG